MNESENPVEEITAPPATPPKFRGAPRRNKSCLRIGCIGCGTVGFVAVSAFLVGSFFFARGLSRYFVEHECETAPLQFPALNVSPEQAQEVVRRVNTFGSAVKNDNAAESLVLTSDEINAWIRTEPELAYFKDYIFAQLIEDKAKLELSFPVDFLERLAPLAKGKFCNMSLTFTPALKDGVFVWTFNTVEWAGKEQPPDVLAAYNAKFNAMTNQRDAFVNLKRQFQSIEVKDGKLIFTLKKKAGTTP